jgi:hypothetical protein
MQNKCQNFRQQKRRKVLIEQAWAGDLAQNLTGSLIRASFVLRRKNLNGCKQ